MGKTPVIVAMTRKAIDDYWDFLESDNVEQFKLLLQNVPAVRTWMNPTGNYPIHNAALDHSGNYALHILEYLIDNGCDINLPNAGGNTPLHIAVDLDNNPTVPLLIAKKAELNCGNHSGHTPLMRAVLVRNIENVKTLLQAGANPNLASDDGSTALSLGGKSRYEDEDQNVIELLRSYGAGKAVQPVTIRFKHEERRAQLDVRTVQNEIRPLIERAIAKFTQSKNDTVTAMGLYASAVNGFISVMIETGPFQGSFKSASHEHVEILDIPSWRKSYLENPRWELISHTGKVLKTKYEPPIELIEKYLFDLLKVELKKLRKEKVFSTLQYSADFKTGVTMWKEDTTYAWEQWPTAIF